AKEIKQYTQTHPDTQEQLVKGYIRLRKTRIERMVEAYAHVEYLIQGFLAEKTYNNGVGQSSIGKSPFFVMMGLCVAFGIPFLGFPVKRSRVLFADYENGDGLMEMEETLADFLGIHASNAEWDEWYATSYCLTRSELEKEIIDFKPKLV